MKTWTPTALSVAVLCAGVAIAQEGRTTALEIGGEAPDFRLNDQDGKAARLQDLRASGWTVLAFFPKALTPG